MFFAGKGTGDRTPASCFFRNRILLLLLVCLVVYSINLHPIPSYDTLPARLLPWNIYENHNFYLDSFAASPQSNILSVAVEENGHYLSPFPIVTPVLVTPFIAVPYIILRLFSIPVSVDNSTFVIVSLVCEKAIASVITALSVCVLYLLLRRMVAERTALLSAMIYAFGTSTWVISSQALWQHGVMELLLCCIMFVILIAAERDSGAKNPLALFAALGILSALYALSRPPDIVYLVPVFIFVILERNSRALAVFFSGLIAAALPFILYNIIYFGSFFGGYKVNAAALQVTPVIIPAFLAYLVSPNRGLFFLSPVLLFSLLGLYLCFKDRVRIKPAMRTVLLLFAICVPVNFLVYCSFPAWWGGESFGYRYLVDSLPVFAVFLAFAVEYLWEKRSALYAGMRVLFVACIVWSVLVQVCGAFYYYYDWDMKGSGHASINDDPSRAWNISDLQVFYGISLNPNPYGLLMDKLRANRSASFYRPPGS